LLANRYLELPYLLRLEIAKELSLVESGDEKLEELERGKRVFERAVAAKKVLQLWHAVNARRGEIEDDEPAPTKGDYGGNCNRSACERRDATYFNASTRKFYCSRCAAAINDANKDYLAAHGVPLCTPGPAEAKYLPLPASPPVESSQGVTGEEIAELRKLEKAASPAPWEADTTDSDGTYGSGDDTHEGFDAREMIGPNGHVLFDSLNSGTAEIHTDTDEDSYRAWDEVARRNFDFVAAFRNAAPRLLATLESQSRRIAELEGIVSKLPKDKNGNPIAVGMHALATGRGMGGDCEANEQPYKVVSVCCDHVWLSQQLDEQDCFHASQCVVFDSLAAALARAGTACIGRPPFCS
jgi:hypothetical protein